MFQAVSLCSDIPFRLTIYLNIPMHYGAMTSWLLLPHPNKKCLVVVVTRRSSADSHVNLFEVVVAKLYNIES